MKALLTGEPIYPPSHKPNKAELAEQKRQAELERTYLADPIDG